MTNRCSHVGLRGLNQVLSVLPHRRIKHRRGSEVPGPRIQREQYDTYRFYSAKEGSHNC